MKPAKIQNPTHEVSHGLDNDLVNPPQDKKAMRFFRATEPIADDDAVLSGARTLSERFRAKIKSRRQIYPEKPTG